MKTRFVFWLILILVLPGILSGSELFRFDPSGAPSFSSIFEPAPSELAEQALEFLKDPSGLTLIIGLGYYSWYDFDEEAIPYTGSDDIRLLFPENASTLWGLRLGIELGRSYIDLRVAPYLGSSALYLEAETGINLLTRDDLATEVFFVQAGFYFWGSMLAFSEPVISAGQAQNFSEDDLEHYSAGNGFTATGIGVNFLIGLRLGPFTISGGFLATASVVLPDHPLAALGWLGPNLMYDLVPGSLSLFLEMRPKRGLRQLTAASLELGVKLFW